MEVTKFGGGIGTPGVYMPGDPQGVDASAKAGKYTINFATGWNKSVTICTGQTPVMKYNKQLMNAIVYDRVDIAKCLNTTVISLDDAPECYKKYDEGAPNKYIIDPNNMIRQKIVNTF